MLKVYEFDTFVLVSVDRKDRTSTTLKNLYSEVGIKSATMVFSSTGHDKLDIQKLGQQSNSPEARWRHTAVTYMVDNKDFVLISGGLIMISTVA